MDVIHLCIDKYANIIYIYIYIYHSFMLHAPRKRKGLIPARRRSKFISSQCFFSHKIWSLTRFGKFPATRPLIFSNLCCKNKKVFDVQGYQPEIVQKMIKYSSDIHISYICVWFSYISIIYIYTYFSFWKHIMIYYIIINMGGLFYFFLQSWGSPSHL